MTTAFAIVYNGLTVRRGIKRHEVQIMTKAQQQIEQDIAVNIGTDLFNAIYYFDDCKTRRGTYNRLAKMNKLQFDGKVAATKRTCMLLIEKMDTILEHNKTFKETHLALYRTLKVHYNTLCSYVSSL